jgi:hypothetical protein
MECSNINYKELIGDKILQLFERRVPIILGKLNEEEITLIHQLVDFKSDIKAIEFANESEKKIVLMYKAARTGYDLKLMMDDIETSFEKRKYTECIKRLRSFITIVDNPSGYIFFKLGLCHLCNDDKQNAVDYFSIAREVNKRDPEDTHNLDDFINRLVEEIKSGVRKDYTGIDTTNITGKKSNEVSIEHIDDIRAMILKGENIYKACEKYGLNEEARCIAALLLAISFYEEKLYTDKAIKLINMVQGVEEITSRVKTLLVKAKTAQRNKNLY